MYSMFKASSNWVTMQSNPFRLNWSCPTVATWQGWHLTWQLSNYKPCQTCNVFLNMLIVLILFSFVVHSSDRVPSCSTRHPPAPHAVHAHGSHDQVHHYVPYSKCRSTTSENAASCVFYSCRFHVNPPAARPDKMCMWIGTQPKPQTTDIPVDLIW